MVDQVTLDTFSQPNQPNNSRSTSKQDRKRYRSSVHRVCMGLLQLALLIYAVILIALVLLESRLVYPAAYMQDGLPGAVGDGAEVPHSGQSGLQRVEYESTDRVRLRGLLIDRPDTENIVLYFHGNGAKAAWLQDWAKRLSDRLDAKVMIAEYRGYEDDTTPSEKGVIDNCFAARDFLCRRYDKVPQDIILYGRSLGGGCAVAVASLGGAKALILERTFDRLVDVAAAKYPVLPVPFLMSNRYDSIAKMTAYKGPLIQLHGTADTLIPIEHAERLFQSSRCQPKHWIAIEGLRHNDQMPPAALSEIAEKVRECNAL